MAIGDIQQSTAELETGAVSTVDAEALLVALIYRSLCKATRVDSQQCLVACLLSGERVTSL